MDQIDSRVLLHASALEGALTANDHEAIAAMERHYARALTEFAVIDRLDAGHEAAQKRIIAIYDAMGKEMREITSRDDARLKVYSFQQPRENHGEASRLIAKLRDVRTGHEEFVYYIQRAYELLFNMAFSVAEDNRKHHIVVRTPVTFPVNNYAVHKMPALDSDLHQSVMCVMLRGALLPSMIMSKEIQEYSSAGYVTPFALFRIKRNEHKSGRDMEYILDLDASYFDPLQLQGKDLIFADPMNATGGSLVTIIAYLKEIGIRPRSVTCFNVISALQGALQIIRSVENAKVYTLWMDPVLNDKAYIMPGLGDAGDRLNGRDIDESPRNMIQLIADYGSNISNLYRSQVRQIEATVLHPRSGRNG